MAVLDDSRGTSIHAELATGERAPTEARRALAVLGPRLADDVSQKLALVASELVTNCVRHSSAGEDGRIELDAIVEDDVVRLSIQDHGHGFEPADEQRPPGASGGWGLKVVERLVERWWIETDAGTRVICELRRS